MESIVTYLAGALEHRVCMCPRFAESLRGPALLVLCKAYRISSKAELWVSVKVLPVDYLVLKRAAMFHLYRGKTVQWGPTCLVPGDGSNAWQDGEGAPQVFDS